MLNSDASSRGEGEVASYSPISPDGIANLFERNYEQWLRLQFFLWLFCLKVLSATLGTWPFLLHTATILSLPEDMKVNLSWRAMLEDPLSWLCAAAVGLCWITWSIAVTGLLRKTAVMMAIGRMLWLIIVLLTLAMSTAAWVLRKTFRPYHDRAIINPAIIREENQKWFVGLFVVPLLACLIGTVLTDCTKKLEIVFKAEEIYVQRSQRAMPAEETTRLTENV